MNKILEGLNKEQLEAVTHKEGPLLIIAGAGTGKTTVITRRIAWLISEGLAKTNEILALTFTDKAAQEMVERVDVLVPYGYTDIWISTFHAFGDRMLRENALVAGLNPDFKVLTRPEAAVFFREHLFEFLREKLRLHRHDLLDHEFPNHVENRFHPVGYFEFHMHLLSVVFLQLRLKAGSRDPAFMR